MLAAAGAVQSKHEYILNTPTMYKHLPWANPATHRATCGCTTSRRKPRRRSWQVNRDSATTHRVIDRSTSMGTDRAPPPATHNTHVCAQADGQHTHRQGTLICTLNCHTHLPAGTQTHIGASTRGKTLPLCLWKPGNIAGGPAQQETTSTADKQCAGQRACRCTRAPKTTPTADHTSSCPVVQSCVTPIRTAEWV